MLLFDDAGEVTQKAVLNADDDLIGAHIPAGIFHSVVALESGSVFFEAKAGPYEQISDKDWGPWAPAEGDANAVTYLARLRSLF